MDSCYPEPARAEEVLDACGFLLVEAEDEDFVIALAARLVLL